MVTLTLVFYVFSAPRLLLVLLQLRPLPSLGRPLLGRPLLITLLVTLLRLRASLGWSGGRFLRFLLRLQKVTGEQRGGHLDATNRTLPRTLCMWRGMASRFGGHRYERSKKATIGSKE